MNIQKHIIQKKNHSIKKEAISNNALKVLYRLNEAGYQAYLVGGAVRDLLLGKQPKDFDVATNARPDEVKALFRNCRLIGRRFRLAHILYGRDLIEVATFRGPHDGKNIHRANQNKEGRITRDNVYGSLEEDAVRRDFTINALYYNIKDESIVDLTRGINDLNDHTIRMIGDTETRYKEDPVRMLRAIRFAAKLDFKMEQQTHDLIFKLSDLLNDIPVARLFDETLKLFQGGYGCKCFFLLREYNIFTLLFPMTEAAILTEAEANNNQDTLNIIEQALINTDDRITQGKSVNPAFFLAVLLWKAMQDYKRQFIKMGQHDMEALFSASHEVIIRQQAHTSIPKRLSLMMREIWHLQAQLQHPTRKRALRTLENKRFRAAYDFLLLRNQVSEQALTEVCQWWTEIQLKSPTEQKKLCDALGYTPKKSAKRRKRRKKKTHTSTIVNDFIVKPSE
ncbi:MAG: polynucleotide adenylyltransferase PcnB [Gammaproteobacteria bacterium]|nr:polynucleotide adenylyltransferase PcnB [Gammaproteobacteria bacterium]